MPLNGRERQARYRARQRGIEVPFLPRATARPLAERFWPKVDKRGPDECWPWKAVKNNMGYGQTSAGGRHLLAHRVAYELLVGPIPEGLVIDHVRARGCTRTDCVNPAHLEPVTYQVNSQRGETGKARGAQMRARTHCPKGHPYDGLNTYHRSSGARGCRVCRAACVRAYQINLTATQQEGTC